MRVYGYARVSSEEQATKGQSLEAQREKIRLYCQLHGLELVETVEDGGLSAKNLRRPGIQRVLKGMKGGKAEGVVVAKLDRLSRSVRDWAELVDGYFCERAGFSLLSVEDSIDTRTAAGRLVLNVLVSVFQWEREAVGERTRTVLAHKKAKGEAVSRPPRGFKIVSKRLAPDPGSDGLRIALRAQELRSSGLTLQAIAETLTAEGFRPERGRRFWPSTVRCILGNPRLTHAAA